MRIIEIFKELSKVPRCSEHRDKFVKYLEDFASQNGYKSTVDDAQNVLIYKPNHNPKLCLQSHYDMVCLGDDEINKSFIPTIYEEDGYLKAKGSTLGADNGIGCAYMLALIEEGQDIECLFTSDEEIGLIGANGLELEIKSNKILNLDSEEEGQIFIGCAGGADIKASFNLKQNISKDDDYKFYQITLKEQQGGHSGVDIDKGIPNAIKLLSRYILKNSLNNSMKLVEFNAGERINSIPKFALAIVASKDMPHSSDLVKVDILEDFNSDFVYDDRLIKFLYSFGDGVRGYDSELNSILSSINLALVYSSKNGHKNITIELSARSMEHDKLELLTDESKILLESFGFEDIQISGKYKPWKPEKNNQFASQVKTCYEKIYQDRDVTYEAIHAGLECAVLKDKYPTIDIVSIGPNIYFPHSFNEEAEISSIIKVYEVVREVLNV
jgi:dipeptidase D